MQELFEIIKYNINDSIQNSGFEVVRLIIVPFLSLITAAMTISVFSATYFIVFRIKKYMKRHKNYLNYTQKLLTSIDEKEVSTFRAFETTMWGKNLDKNKKLIGDVFSKYKNADLKDLILGTYNDELNSVKSIINDDNKLIKNNQNFIKFQRLFHKYTKNGVIVEYFNMDYISFYKVRRGNVIIGIMKKTELEALNIDIKYNVNFSEIFTNDILAHASLYKIYFLKRQFIYKNISNPDLNFEKKIVEIKKIYKNILKKKYSNYNVYLKPNFETWPKLKKIKKGGSSYLIDDNLLLEAFNHNRINRDTSLSQRMKIRKEIKELIKKKK